MIDDPARIESAMVIVAHADDAEYTVAGTVAKWARAGCEVTYVICTDGGKGTSDPSVDPRDLISVRQQEQNAAARLLGVRNVVFLGYEDGILFPTLELRRDIVRAIRRYRPQVAICEDPTLRWSGSGYINHPDHIAAAEAALAAIFPSARDHLFSPELIAEGLLPHKVREVLIAAPAEPDTWIDVTGTMELKIAALLEHRSQVAGPEQAEWVRDWGRETAGGHGMEYAESFKYFGLE